MGDLKPIGSEKLKGEDKLKRILELTYFNENKNVPSSPRAEIIKESTIGGIYGIVKEKDSYYVKRGLNESSLDYIGGMFMKNKNRFSSYSEALKRLELLKGQEELQEATKYVLKQPKPVAAEEPMAPPAEAVADMPPALPPAEGDGEPMSDVGLDDIPTDGAEDAPSPESEEDNDPIKLIQKLTGKLGQKLRSAQEDMESDDIKYVINSVVSALNLDKLDSIDKEEILTQFEDEEDYEGEEPEMGGEEVAPEGEDSDLGEENDLSMDALEALINTPFEEIDEDDDFGVGLTPGGEEDEYFRNSENSYDDEDGFGDFDFNFDIKEEDPIDAYEGRRRYDSNSETKISKDDIEKHIDNKRNEPKKEHEPRKFDTSYGDWNEEGEMDDTVELDINELTDVINQSVKEALGKYIK
jgi:hypothetical protein